MAFHIGEKRKHLGRLFGISFIRIVQVKNDIGYLYRQYTHKYQIMTKGAPPCWRALSTMAHRAPRQDASRYEARDAIAVIASRHCGRVVDTAGDNALAEFPIN
jgi:hypothetical protein